MNRIRFVYILSCLLLLCRHSYAQVQSDSILSVYLNNRNVSMTTDNEVTLLLDGQAKFDDLFAEVGKAKHHVHLEYFNFRNDSIANSLFELLKKKASQGVEIRAMFDSFGNSSNNQPLKKKHLEALRANGIEIVKFDPVRFPWINHVFHRDHRKIVVIDGKVGYTGGMNIADYYIDGLPEIGEWHDIHVRIEGPAVHDLQDVFLYMWNQVTKQDVGGEEYYPRLVNEKCGDKSIAIVNRLPKKNPTLMRQVYAEAIESAEDYVRIINPYFVPTHRIKKAIKSALKKGVKVEIMISGKSDIKFTPEAGLFVANSLRKRGADVYIYNGGFHHSKIMMIDSLHCTVGSTNLNSRSLRYDHEINAFIFSPETTAQLDSLFASDKKCSTLLTHDIYMKRTVWKRFVGWFAHLFTPFL